MNRVVKTGYAHSTSVILRGSHKAGLRFPFVQWIVVTGALVLLVLPFGSFSNFPEAIVVWGTAMFLFFLAFHGFRVSRRLGENPWLAPCSLLMMFYFFKYGFGALVVYYWSQFPWEIFPYIGTVFERYGVQENLPNTCQLFLLGGIGLYLGTRLSARRLSEWLPPLRWRVDDTKFNLNLILYTPIALFIFVVLQWYLPATIRFTVFLFGWIALVMIVIASYRLFSLHHAERLKWLILLSLMYVAIFPLFLLTVMREYALRPALMIVLGYIMARGRLPWRLIIPAIALMFFFISPWLSLYKLVEQRGQSVLERIAVTNTEFADTPARGRFELAVGGLVGRLVGSGSGATSVFSQYYPEVYPFELGRTFVIELSALVPRVLWPGKPNLSYELNMYTYGVGTLQDPETTAATFDAISEYYINFGTFGVFFLSILHGYYLKVLYEWLIRRSIYEIGASIYLVLFFINHDFFGVVQIFTSHTRQLVVWPLLLYLMSRRS